MEIFALYCDSTGTGATLTREELDIVYQRFTALADRKKGLLDEEIAGLVVESQKAQAAVNVE